MTLVVEEENSKLEVRGKKDAVLSDNLTGSSFKERVLQNKKRSEIYSELLQNEEVWTYKQTFCLYNELDDGQYNLSQIKREFPELKEKHLLDIHDRAIVLLVLRELMVWSPVKFLHNSRPNSFMWSMKTLQNVTLAFRNLSFYYNGHFASPDDAPKDLRRLYQLKLARAHRIISDYHGCYESTFDVSFQYEFKDLKIFQHWHDETVLDLK